jgi:hypothetical protein
MLLEGRLHDLVGIISAVRRGGRGIRSSKGCHAAIT